jgi:hypothetical protein
MRQLRFYGPPENFQQVAHEITDMLREESSSYEIDLKFHQFSWTIHGGFKSIEQALGKNVAIFNVVSSNMVRCHEGGQERLLSNLQTSIVVVEIWKLMVSRAWRNKLHEAWTNFV